MKLAIIGSRGYEHKKNVVDFVRSQPRESIIVSGGAIGVDTWAEEEAIARDMDTVIIRPDYKRYDSKAAPHIRNRLIVEMCDELAAFWDGKSPGTKSVIELARNCGKLMAVFGAENSKQLKLF